MDWLDRSTAYPERPALILPHERCSYGQLRDRARFIARALISLGVTRGDHVGVYLANSVDCVAAIFASSMTGAVAVPISTRFRNAELAAVVDGVQPRVVLSGQAVGDRTARAEVLAAAVSGRERRSSSAPSTSDEVRIVELTEPETPSTGTAELAALAAATSADLLMLGRGQASDPGLIIFTSGTTSTPKGVVLSHGTVARWGAIFADRFALDLRDCVWDAKPLFHVGALAGVLGCIVAGATYCTMPFFDAEVAAAQFAQERVTVAWPVYDTIWLRVIDNPGFATADTSALRAIGLVGHETMLRAVQRRFPHAAVVSSYGSSECNPAALARPDDAEDERMTSVGRRAAGVDIRVVDPVTGADVRPGEVGELVYRGPNIFLGYHDDPVLTAQKLVAGWYWSGDLGSIDGAGIVRYVGRTKDMLKVGGENVAAAEIENVLLAHPAVTIAAAIGIPDDTYGEIPAGFVELRAGRHASETELVAFCRERIAGFKVPRVVRLVTQWPMSATKIDKAALRAQLVDELGT